MAGLKVGHYSDLEHGTGVTVAPPKPARRMGLRFRDFEGAADFLGQFIGNLGVPGDGFDVAGLGIAPEGMRAAFALEIASLPAQVPEQGLPFHRTVTIS